MEIDPKTLEPQAAYKLLIGAVVPRPIAVVSTLSRQGVANLAPFSYFSIAGHDPMAVSLSVAGPKIIGGLKDTLENLLPREGEPVREFVVHVASANYARQIAEAAAPLPPEQSEFDLTGLTTTPASVVAPPRVAEARLALECRTMEIVPVGGARLVIGEVVHVHADDGVVDDRCHVDQGRLDAVGRMAGSMFVRTADRYTVRTEDYVPEDFKA